VKFLISSYRHTTPCRTRCKKDVGKEHGRECAAVCFMPVLLVRRIALMFLVRFPQRLRTHSSTHWLERSTVDQDKLSTNKGASLWAQIHRRSGVPRTRKLCKQCTIGQRVVVKLDEPLVSPSTEEMAVFKLRLGEFLHICPRFPPFQRSTIRFAGRIE